MKSLKTLIKSELELSDKIEHLPGGDCPGDTVSICEQQIVNAKTLMGLIVDALHTLEKDKIVIGIYGGSGSGKSGIASLLSHYLNANHIKTYRMSGDNYPRRIPQYNDAERVHLFRQSGLQELVKQGAYTMERFEIVQALQKQNEDSNPKTIDEHPWMKIYIEGGRKGLKGYLGTAHEQDYREVENILEAFKSGAEKVYMKRMGREETELWYEDIDMSETQILILEWTHANNDALQGVDLPILLNSTPAETLEHRRARNRGDEVDTPFITMVLEIEQNLLDSQAHKAKIILSKDGDVLDYEAYLKAMGKEEGNKHE